MNTETVVNIAANSTTAFSALGLLIHVFGDPNNPIWDNAVKAWLAKVGLSVASCGAILNVLTFSNPPVTEVILNVGISLTFFWLNWWQWEIFKATHMSCKVKVLKNLNTPRMPTKSQKRKTTARRKSINEDSYYK